LTAAWRAACPIVRVFHVDGPKTASNAFAPNPALRPLAELHPFDAAATFTRAHSALVGTGLTVADTEWHSAPDRQRHPHRAMLRDHHRHASDLG
jgi:hypothetical protein